MAATETALSYSSSFALGGIEINLDLHEEHDNLVSWYAAQPSPYNRTTSGAKA